MGRTSSQEHDSGVARPRMMRNGPAVGVRPGDGATQTSGPRRPKKKRDGIGGRADLCYDPVTGRKLPR
jgi:hypothetical protein